MTEGLSPDLVLAGAVVFLGILLVLVRRIGIGWTLAVAGVKALFFLVHFGYLDDGSWRVMDDVTYHAEAARMLAQGIGPWSALTTAHGLVELVYVSGGQHVAYFWWNLLAQSLLGDHYFAPVAFNIVLMALAAAGLHRILDLVGAGRRFATGAVVFYSLHWDVLVWSNCFNLKDSMVAALTLWMLVSWIRFQRKPGLRPALALAAIAVCLTYVRFYVPLLLVVAAGLHAALALRGWRRQAVLGVACVGFLLGPAVAVYAGSIHPGLALTGTVRFLFTPRPWGITSNYAFLLLPSVLHWLMAPLLAYGLWLLWKRLPDLRCVLIYGAVVVAFYACVPELQGPRHRFQIVFLLALAQYGAVVDLARRFTASAPFSRGLGLEVSGSEG